jgi:hypothetical protein
MSDFNLRKQNEYTINCVFELYIINNQDNMDCDLGDNLSNTISENGYDYFDDVIEIYDEIARKIYPNCEGEYKYLISVDLKYRPERDYFGEYDDNFRYEYSIIGRERTDYWED